MSRAWLMGDNPPVRTVLSDCPCYHTDPMAEAIALVTGANKGIGREISRQLANQGIFVLIGARDRERGEKAAADLRALGLQVDFIQIDVTSQPDVDGAAGEMARRKVCATSTGRSSLIFVRRM